MKIDDAFNEADDNHDEIQISALFLSNS